jgi:hypothetical protein
MKELGLYGRRPDGLPQSIRYLSRDEPSQIFYGDISTLCKSQGARHDLKELLEPVHKRPIFTNTAQNFKNLHGSVAARLEVGAPAGFLERWWTADMPHRRPKAP